MSSRSRYPTPPAPAHPWATWPFPAVGRFAVTLLLVLAWTPAIPAQHENEASDDAVRQAESVKTEHDELVALLQRDFPDSYDALRIQGYLHSSVGRMEEMAACWRRCRDLKPDRAEIHDQLGRYAAQQEDYAAAIEAWQTALRLDPKLPLVRKNIGYALLNSAQPAAAVEMLEAELAQSPQLAEAHYLLGEARFQLGELPLAKTHYQQSMMFDPQDSKPIYGLIKTCLRLGQTEEVAQHQAKFQAMQDQLTASDVEARKQYDDLRMLHTQLAASYVESGRLYADAARNDAALRCWRRAVELDDQNVTAHQILTEHFTAAGDSQAVVPHLTALADLQPEKPDHLQRLGFIHARLGNLAAAESVLRRGVQQHPRDAASYRGLAKFYLNTKRQVPLAQKLAAAAVQLEPVAESHFVLGWAHAMQGNRDDALRSLQQALALEPNNKMYRHLFEMVQRRE